MSKEIFITAALTGSGPTKEMNPAVPYSPEEIIQAAIDCYHAGAAIVHVHVRDPETGKPDFKVKYFRKVLEGIRCQADLIVNLTTSGLNIEGPRALNKRFGPIYLHPDLASLDVGSVNTPTRVFMNPPIWSLQAAKFMQKNGVKPEIEVFDVGHIAQALELVEKGFINNPSYFQLCMGFKYGIPASEENLKFMQKKLPLEAVWSVLGVGKAQDAMISLAIDMGGNIRVGLEDNIYLSKGVPGTNAQFVERAATWASNHGRTPVGPAEARKILGLK